MLRRRVVRSAEDGPGPKCCWLGSRLDVPGASWEDDGLLVREAGVGDGQGARRSRLAGTVECVLARAVHFAVGAVRSCPSWNSALLSVSSRYRRHLIEEGVRGENLHM